MGFFTPSHSRDRGMIVFLISTILSSLAFQYFQMDFHHIFNYFTKKPNISEQCNLFPEHNGPTYAIYGKSSSEEHLKHVKGVLDLFGYKRSSVDKAWNLLWAHDYPFRVLTKQLKQLNKNQKVNHFPGSGYITNKVDLCTSNLPFMPKAFRLPKDKDNFINYAQKYPKKLFVQKHNEHRYIFIKSAKEINLDSNETFVQEFVDNPYLVDGYKFDIGVYVIITSFKPLRIYLYKGDVLFRYCPIQYYPFDNKNVDKYVVGDDYLPTWEVPSLKYYYNVLKYSMKDSFDAYVREQHQDPVPIWRDVEQAIRSAVLAKQESIEKILNNYKNTRNFFELIRFDLIIDNNLRVHLMEANMSPNLSSAHFKQNSLLYEQVLYSALNLVGVGSPVKKIENSFDNTEFISSDKNIVVEANICSQSPCANSCADKSCKICFPCLSKLNREILSEAYKEYIHKTDTKRIFPVPIDDVANYDIEESIKGLSPENELMTRWFYGKCKIDPSWC